MVHRIRFARTPTLPVLAGAYVPLSGHATEIVPVLARGHRNREIADGLDLAQDAVKTYVPAVLRQAARRRPGPGAYSGAGAQTHLSTERCVPRERLW